MTGVFAVIDVCTDIDILNVVEAIDLSHDLLVSIHPDPTDRIDFRITLK